jgi:hypothetical protein
MRGWMVCAVALTALQRQIVTNNFMLHLREPLRSIERRHSLHVLVHLGRRIGKFQGHDSALARVVARYRQSQVTVKQVY